MEITWGHQIMNFYKRLIFLIALLMLMPSLGIARSGMARKQNKAFNQLIIQGERPEIASCVVKSIETLKKYKDGYRVPLDEGITERAILRETKSADHMMRTIEFNVNALTDQGSFLTRVESLHVICTQYDESNIEIKIEKNIH